MQNICRKGSRHWIANKTTQEPGQRNRMRKNVHLIRSKHSTPSKCILFIGNSIIFSQSKSCHSYRLNLNAVDKQLKCWPPFSVLGAL